jgi:hypothetical protein
MSITDCGVIVWNRRLEACKSHSASLENEVFIQSVGHILVVKLVQCEQGHSSGTESTEGGESMREHKYYLQYHMKHGKYSLVRTTASFLHNINWSLNKRISMPK